MAVMIRYRKVYQLTVTGRDLKSGKAVVNIYHCRSGLAAAPPAWGTQLAGSSSASVLATFRLSYIANILPLMSVNLAVQEYKLQSIDGWTQGGPSNPVASATNATPIVVGSAVAHFLKTGDTVVISGSLGNTAANGTWVITKVDATHFSLNGSGGNGAYTGGGLWQKVAGEPRLVHSEQDTLVPASADLGGVAGDALPLIATMSVRKLNANVGRNWRGRLSMSPLPETGYNDGKAANATHTATVAAWTAFVADPSFGNIDPPVAPQDFMVYMMFSHSIAIITATPFTSETAYSVPLSDLVPRQNLGGLTRRKPRLTSPIA